jgi:hypothetical protein
VNSLDEFMKSGLVEIDDSTGCFIWNKTKFGNGYGRYKYNKRAHRVAWEIVNGPIPNGLLVLHHCDVRACVNPEHLFIGTQLDNMRDMISKGRKVVLKGKESYFASEEYREKVSGENHWTTRQPERIAKGDRHWSRLHKEKFSEMSKNGKYQKINTEMKGNSDV